MLTLPQVGPDTYDPAWDELDRGTPEFGPQHFDREGEPITMRQWLTLTSLGQGTDEWYNRIAQTEIGSYRVSTVWLGLDHGFGQARRRPLIFETMIFGPTGHDEGCERYATETDAREGHARLCEEVRLIVDALSKGE